MTAVAEALVHTISTLDKDAVADEDLLDPAIFAVLSESVRRLGADRTRAIVEEALMDCEMIVRTVELLRAERAAAGTAIAANE